MKRYLTLKSAGIAVAALLLVGAGAAGAMVLGGGSSSSSATTATNAPAGPDFASAFGSDENAAAAQPKAAQSKAMAGKVNKDVLLGSGAKAIGISAKDLKAQVQQGKTLAQIASDHNVSSDALKTALQNGEKAYLDRSVQSGLITQQYADQTLQGFTARLDTLIGQAISVKKAAQ